MLKFKKLATILAGIMLFSAVGCSNPAATTSNDTKTSANTTSKKRIVGYCMPDTSEAFLASLSNSVKELFAKDGVEVQIANAAGDANTQVSQIENFATMKADLIILMPVDPTSVSDAIKRAQAAGTKVLVAGADPGIYDALMFINQYDDGKMIAEMAADFIQKKFPNAAPGSIEVAIFESRDTPEATQRCEGMAEITKFSPAAKVVKVVGGIKNTAEAQAAAENLFQTNPNVKVILTYNSSGAIGVNAYAMMAGSKVTDKSSFGVFASDLNPEVKQALIDSASDKSVIRGIIKFGSNDLAGDTYKLASKMINGEKYEVKNPDPLSKVTPENASQF
ncbi:sugar ABC transporter substrate-binding protein [Clostridium sp. SYSU_GA19001]|uniref:sugar ABC transporter substrate-binding protein n=1 Tax=Clostridium caldaquaticum TaxID=2940653 RepID=UPI0020775A86|nr:sugar ABC transporter substrate-binding protein [Clostridium caldaquaticum]MCM8710313.1 sugar ABC transporter substrate-binding protein [Clostridium caldaquaticum]